MNFEPLIQWHLICFAQSPRCQSYLTQQPFAATENSLVLGRFFLMPDITTDGLKQFVAAAKPLHRENGWADFDLEVARRACLQWTPLETCEAKKQILKKISSLLTVARFALQGSIDLERYELPVPKAPPADFHPCQDICTVKDLEQRLREHYSYAGSLAPAEELFKYMAKRGWTLQAQRWRWQQPAADPCLHLQNVKSQGVSSSTSKRWKYIPLHVSCPKCTVTPWALAVCLWIFWQGGTCFHQSSREHFWTCGILKRSKCFFCPHHVLSSVFCKLVFGTRKKWTQHGGRRSGTKVFIMWISAWRGLRCSWKKRKKSCTSTLNEQSHGNCLKWKLWGRTPLF